MLPHARKNQVLATRPHHAGASALAMYQGTYELAAERSLAHLTKCALSSIGCCQCKSVITHVMHHRRDAFAHCIKVLTYCS